MLVAGTEFAGTPWLGWLRRTCRSARLRPQAESGPVTGLASQQSFCEAIGLDFLMLSGFTLHAKHVFVIPLLC